MNYENLLLTVENSILTITINRPAQLNALNGNTLTELEMAVNDAEKNSEIKAIIITGSGEKAFVAGADIKEFMNYSPDEAQVMSRKGHRIFDKIESCSKPIIAAINGFALGAGCELAMACHLRVAAENAKFSQPEVNLGVIPGYGGTQRLIQNLGKTKAFELLMTGDMISAQEALQLGLVNYVVTPNELINKAIELINKITQKSPNAISKIIHTVNAYFDNTQNGFEVEINDFANCFQTPDFKEGTVAFTERRKPKFN